MKRSAFIALLLLISLFIVSCAPVLRKEIMEQGARNVPLSEIMQNPDAYRGKLLIFGGYIINTTVTAEGSLIEALYVDVDSRGSLESSVDGRFLALFPRKNGILDPVIFRKGREITLAAEFIGTRERKLDETTHVYPLFRIDELYLWEVQWAYSYPPPYYAYPPFGYGLLYFDMPFLRRHHHGGPEHKEHGGPEHKEHGGPEHKEHGGPEHNEHGGPEHKEHGGPEHKEHGGPEHKEHGEHAEHAPGGHAPHH